MVRGQLGPVLNPAGTVAPGECGSVAPGESAAAPGRAAPGQRPRCAVLGSPIGHSLSPLLHRAAYAALGLDWEYTAADVDAQALPAFVDALDGTWRGLSLTMPLKWAVLPLLDELDPVAATVGTVNTLLFGPHRPGARPLRRGVNTDVGGIAAALVGPDGTGDPRWRRWRDAGDAVVLGAGATACSVLAALPRDVPVTVLARDPSRADRLRGVADRLDRPIRLGRLPNADDDPGVGRGGGAPGAGRGGGAGSGAAGAGTERPGLLVSTLPGGALPTVPTGLLPGPLGTVFDVVYHGWPTPLARAGAAGGARVLSGLDLLVHQAVGQVEAMTGRPVAASVLAAALVAGGVPGSDAVAARTRSAPAASDPA